MGPLLIPSSSLFLLQTELSPTPSPPHFAERLFSYFPTIPPPTSNGRQDGSIFYPRFPSYGSQPRPQESHRSILGRQISQDDLLAEGKRLRLEHWKIQKDAGIDIIPSNDFAFYDRSWIISSCLVSFLSGTASTTLHPLTNTLPWVEVCRSLRLTALLQSMSLRWKWSNGSTQTTTTSSQHCKTTRPLSSPPNPNPLQSSLKLRRLESQLDLSFWDLCHSSTLERPTVVNPLNPSLPLRTSCHSTRI